MEPLPPALLQLKRIWWRLANPDVSPEEWALLQFLATSLGRGVSHGELGAVTAIDDDFRSMVAFAEKFIDGEATMYQAKKGWQDVLNRLYKAGVLKRFRVRKEAVGVPVHKGQADWCYRYQFATPTDYQYYWEHPEQIPERLRQYPFK